LTTTVSMTSSASGRFHLALILLATCRAMAASAVLVLGLIRAGQVSIQAKGARPISGHLALMAASIRTGTSLEPSGVMNNTPALRTTGKSMNLTPLMTEVAMSMTTKVL